MDFKMIMFAVVQFLLIVSSLATPDHKPCLVGYLWDDAKQTCVRCLNVCKTENPRAASCLKRCFGTSKTLTAMYVTRRRRDVNKSCRDVTCQPGEFCDVGIGSCSSCYVICDFSHIQGTTEQCNSLCAGYLTSPTTTVKYETTKKAGTSERDAVDAWPPFLLPVLSTILGSILLVGIIGLGFLCHRYRNNILRLCQSEEKKAPFPCSQESELECINSQTPLTRANGPIAEERNCPVPDTGAPLMRNLGQEMGFPEVQCPYRELDGPETHSTNPKRIMVNVIQ